MELYFLLKMLENACTVSPFYERNGESTTVHTFICTLSKQIPPPGRGWAGPQRGGPTWMYSFGVEDMRVENVA
jgi:hypothetical protein